MSRASPRLERESREIVTSVVKTVLLCIINNSPYKVTRLVPARSFVNLISFKIDAGDHALAEHFKKYKKCQIHKPADSERILDHGFCSHCEINDIICEVNRSYFSVIAEESADISVKSNLLLF